MKTLVWDQQTFSARLKNRDDRIQKVISIFLESFPDKVQKIIKEIEDQDRSAIKDSAHNLKGASANLSATSLNQTMVRIETLLQVGEALPSNIKEIIEGEAFALTNRLNEFKNLRETRY